MSSNVDQNAHIRRQVQGQTQQLPEGEQRYRGICDSAQDAIITIDERGNISQWNAAATRIFGHTEEEALGKNAHEFLSVPKYLPQFRAAWPRYQETGQGNVVGKTVQLDAVRKDGEEFPIELSLSALSVRGRWHAIAIIRDISERKRAEKALQQRTEELQAICDGMSDGLLVTDVRTKEFRRANPAISKMLGYSEQELLSMAVADIHPAGRLPGILEKFNAIAEGRESRVGPIPLLRKDESIFYAEVTAGRVVSYHGDDCLVGFFRDVTERMLFEEQLVKQNCQVLGINQVFEKTLACETAEEVAEVCLAVAEKLTGSKFGLIGELNDAGLFDTLAISNPGWDACEMSPEEARRRIRNMPARGIDRSTLREGTSRIVNDPATHPDRIGVPRGHPPITCFLGVPLKHAGKTIGMIGLGNKESGYELADQEAVEALSCVFVAALMRKRAEQAVKESEQRYRTLLGAVTSYTYSVEVENGTPVSTLHNPGCVSATGYTPEDYASAPNLWISMVHPDDQEMVGQRVAKVLAGEESSPIEHRIIHKDGSIRWIGDTIVQHRDDRGRLIRYDGLVEDITERKRMDEVKRLDEARLEALLELSRMAEAPLEQITNFALEQGIRLTGSSIGYVGFLDEEETVVTMTSWSTDVMEQCGIADKPRRFSAKAGGLCGEAIRQRKPVVINDYSAPHPAKRGCPEGHIPQTRFMSIPVFDGERIVAVAAVANKEEKYDESDVRQLTLLMQGMWRLVQRKQAEEALRKKDEELRQSQKLEAVGQLAGGIAHEFNNLLQAISGHTGFAMEGLSPEEQRYQDLHQVRKAADRAAALTHQLLGFGRRQMLRRKNVAPNGVVADLGKLVGPVIGERIELDLTLGENVGTVLADPGELQQVLLNLCLNARDAMPSGGRLLVRTENVVLRTAIRTSAADVAPGRYAVISVTDTGWGMPSEVKERIFEPFFTTKEVGQGTGLGLATAYGIVEQHGGTIHVYSEPGRGTTFKVYLPTVEAAVIDDTDAERMDVPGGTETILVAEDEPIVRDFAVRVLREAGYRVLDASNGEEAMRVYQDHRNSIALLLLDAVMPGLTGHQVYDRVRADDQDVKVVFCTGYDPKTARSSFMKQENLRVIQKPFDPDTLLQTIREVLDAEEPCQLAEVTS